MKEEHIGGMQTQQPRRPNSQERIFKYILPSQSLAAGERHRETGPREDVPQWTGLCRGLGMLPQVHGLNSAVLAFCGIRNSFENLIKPTASPQKDAQVWGVTAPLYPL